ncbi:Divalent-cation tolerance protein CutA [Thalassoglobus neptunius]|uniref:Divalent-cation tolerance protein CutA n=1 Tax=Thalassoglobus neptunius TaxID=1938619 RepID=A0A5C5WYV3_9PLAN|nr:divalent-cation tolerance protein CutA [Thalassoglobus neptunius]TWT55780.1 Divalent-cation tolerance protein CutA [Thalassoglobus neptunius]
MPAALVYITTSSQEEALSIAQVAVKEGLAACGNVIPGVVSVYNWEGSVQVDGEVLLLLKTSDSKVSELSSRVRELHSYDLPCIVAYTSVGGDPEYLKWVEDQVSGE